MFEKTKPLDRYLQEASKYPLLTIEEERRLALQAQMGNKEAGKKLVLANLRLVVKISHEYKNHDNLHDLIQEGNVGLMHAVGNYDPEEGTKFSYYASFWIRASILKYIIDSWSLVKIGTTSDKRKIFYRLNREREKLEKSGIVASTENLADSLEVSFAVIEEMEQRMAHRDNSLDALLQDDGSSFMDMTGNGEDVEKALIEKDLFEMLKKKLNSFRERLNEKERFVLDNRIMADEKLTLKKIGKHLNMTGEGVRQMQVRILDNLTRLEI